MKQIPDDVPLATVTDELRAVLNTTRVYLPWSTPPLRSNARLHWAEKMVLTRNIRDAARLAARDVPPFDVPVTITLVWTVTDKRRRDVGASSPTLKAAIDGLVDAGILVRGDSHEWVTEERLRIEVGPRPGVRLEIAVDDNSAGRNVTQPPQQEHSEDQ